MDGLSLNIREEQLNKMRDIFPEVVSKEKIDWKRLRATFGEVTFISNERYVLNWAGKSDASRIQQTGKLQFCTNTKKLYTITFL